jgi:hypothetical protein
VRVFSNKSREADRRIFRGLAIRRLAVLGISLVVLTTGQAAWGLGTRGQPDAPRVSAYPSQGPGETKVHVDGCCWTYINPKPTVVFRDAHGATAGYGNAALVACHGYFACEFDLDIVIPGDAAVGLGHVRMVRGTIWGTANFTVTPGPKPETAPQP